MSIMKTIHFTVLLGVTMLCGGQGQGPAGPDIVESTTEASFFETTALPSEPGLSAQGSGNIGGSVVLGSLGSAADPGVSGQELTDPGLSGNIDIGGPGQTDPELFGPAASDPGTGLESTRISGPFDQEAGLTGSHGIGGINAGAHKILLKKILKHVKKMKRIMHKNNRKRIEQRNRFRSPIRRGRRFNRRMGINMKRPSLQQKLRNLKRKNKRRGRNGRMRKRKWRKGEREDGREGRRGRRKRKRFWRRGERRD